MPVSTRIARMSAATMAEPLASTTCPRNAPVAASCGYALTVRIIRERRFGISGKQDFRRGWPTSMTSPTLADLSGREEGQGDLRCCITSHQESDVTTDTLGMFGFFGSPARIKTFTTEDTKVQTA